jgi:PAS domain S-box-containing protein
MLHDDGGVGEQERKVSAPTRGDAELAVLVRSLELHQAELEMQNHELVAAVDELRTTNTALTHARDRYRALHDLAPVALVTVDMRAMVVEINDAASRLLGAAGSVVDRRLAVFAPDDARVRIAEFVAELFRRGVIHDHSTRLVGSDGQPFPVRIDGTVLRDAGPPRAVLAIVDLRALEAAGHAERERERNTEAVRRVESLSVLAGGVAHHFNNLLTVILAGTESALDAVEPGSASAELLDQARSAAVSAGKLAHQLLGYSGHLSVSPRATDLTAMVRELSKELRELAKPTPLVLELPEASPRVSCDVQQIRRLIEHLVVNASEATAQHQGVITVAIRSEVSASSVATLAFHRPLPPGPCVVLEIRDEGAGMDSVTQQRMFEPYFTTKLDGRGLGLAVVEGIVRGHQAALAVESVSGHGTTVRVYFPALISEPTVLEPRVVAPKQGATTVLVVDDEPIVRRTMVSLLTRKGFVVHTASDGVEAVDLVRGGLHVDLVLMDHTMPRMDGIKAGTEVRALRPELPLILITGYGTLPRGTSMFAATLAKPFDVTALLALIRLLTGASSA